MQRNLVNNDDMSKSSSTNIEIDKNQQYSRNSSIDSSQSYRQFGQGLEPKCPNTNYQQNQKFCIVLVIVSVLVISIMSINFGEMSASHGIETISKTIR